MTKRERVLVERMERELARLRDEHARRTQLLSTLLDGVIAIAGCLERREPVGSEVLAAMVAAASHYWEALAQGGPEGGKP